MGATHASGAGPMKDQIIGALVAAVLWVFLVFALRTAYNAGHIAGRQESPMACEPKCEFVYRGPKPINVNCPHRLGRMP